MQFSHEHEELRRTLKRFIDDEINPHVDEWEAAEAFPAHEVFKKLGELGLLGLNKPSRLRRRRRSTTRTRWRWPRRWATSSCGARADGDRRADRHVHAGAGALRQRRAAPRVPGAGHRGRHGRLHRRERARRRQRRGRPQEPRAQGRRRLPHHRPEDVDHQQPAGRLDVHAGQHQRRRRRTATSRWSIVPMDTPGHREGEEDPQDRHAFERHRAHLLRQRARAAALPHRRRRPGLRLPDAAVPGRAAVGRRQFARSRWRTASPRPSNGRSSARCSAARWPTSSGCSSSWPN